ncbi:MAG: hypothetical protein IJ785_02300 [Bacteroidales bacterium]|nr:hypothetical protein [Bacteroidales bacterium]
MNSKFVCLLCLLAGLALTFTSCNKQDDGTAATQQAQLAMQNGDALSAKTTPIKVIIISGTDTLTFEGTIQKEADGSYSLEGTLTMPDGSRYGCQGRLYCQSHTFSGTVRDEQGNAIEPDASLIDAMIQVVEYSEVIKKAALQHQQ